jgi:hypothetical protein
MKKAPLFICAIAAAALGNAHASCGLHFCPRPQEETEGRWKLGFAMHEAGFDIGGTSGSYSEGVAQIGFTAARSWVFNLHVPIVALDAGAGTVLGLGNPLATAEFQAHPFHHQMLGFGLQSELPFGDADKGLAQHHFMLMPYGSWSGALGRFFLTGTTGVSLALGGMHGESHGDAMAGAHAGHDGSMAGMAHMGSHEAGMPLYVHPHEDLELAYKLSLGSGVWGGKAVPELYLSGQHVLAEELEQGGARDYLSIGIVSPFHFGRYVLSPDLELPVTAEHRFEWAMGLGIGLGF